MIPVLIDMTDEQVADYAAEFGLRAPVRARDVVEHVRTWAIADLTRGRLGEFADVSIKR